MANSKEWGAKRCPSCGSKRIATEGVLDYRESRQEVLASMKCHGCEAEFDGHFVLSRYSHLDKK